MTTLPNGLSRYTGANTFTAQDYAGNIFYVFQDTKDNGRVVMVKPNGETSIVLSIANSGRPALECIPHIGLWAVGNKEASARETPPRYPIQEYVPYPQGGSASGGLVLLDTPAVSPDWDRRAFNGGLLIDVPSVFNVPRSSIYLFRLAAAASIPNVRARVGSVGAAYQLTVNTQLAGIEVHGQGFASGPETLVSTVNGAVTMWLQVIGFWA